MSLKILMTPVGSHGDMHPWLGLGMAMVQRGHDVTVMADGRHEALARKVGLKFVSTSLPMQPLDGVPDPDLWHPRRSFASRMTLALSQAETLYRAIQNHHQPGKTVLVGDPMALASRVAHEKLGVPLVGVHLSPWVLRSVHRPGLPGHGWSGDPSWLPAWALRMLWHALDRRVYDPVLCPSLNHWRWELGLEPVARPLQQWIHAPGLTLGLWPDWFAPMQPDWPSQLRLTGFSFFDQSGLVNMPPALRSFLEEGPPPLVFASEVEMIGPRHFFQEAVSVCMRLGRRGIFLTRHSQWLPAHLPQDILHFDYVPLSQLLPRACAFVHQGNMGKCAAGLAAGVPQLVVPMAYDQPEHAARLARLGVAQVIKPARFHASAMEVSLARLIDQPRVWATCQAHALKCHQHYSREDACALIESYAHDAGVTGDDDAAMVAGA